MKKTLVALLVVALCFSAFACGNGGSTDGETVTGNVVEGTTIKIGVFEPTTGENGGGGMQEVLGVRYANQVAPTVTVNGTEYTIELVEVDNQSDKTAAVTAAQSLITSNVVAVIGSYGSGVAIAAGETFANAAVAAVGCSCTNPQVTLDNPYYFRVCFLDPFQGTVMATYAFEKGYTKAAVLSQNGDDYSTGLAEYFKAAFTKLGGEIVADETYQTNDTDFNAQLTTIKGTDAQVLFAPSSIQTATLLLPQAKAAGITAAIMAGDTWENQTIIDDAQGAAEGVSLSTFFDENDNTSTVAKDFVKGFKEYLNSDPANIAANGNTDGVAAVSALGYDAYMTIYNAIASLDGTEGDITSVAIRDAIANVNYAGVTGNITFDENGDAQKDTAYIKEVKDGKFVFVKTQVTE